MDDQPHQPPPPPVDPPPVERFASPQTIDHLVRTAREEDMGPRGVDITSELFVAPEQQTHAVMKARQPGVLSGLVLLPMIARAYDNAISVKLTAHDGSFVHAGHSVAEFAGPLRSVLAMERVALNFVTHLSGIASLTSRYVAAVASTPARIYDTRKTIPGLRGLAKYAVVCGGGQSHRVGLHDAVLVKDNHIAHLMLYQLEAAMKKIIRDARARRPAPAFIEVEVDTFEQLEVMLHCEPDVILLDNMDVQQLETAVAMRTRLAPLVHLEASGGVNLQTVGRIAQTGVDRIAVGAITHSAPAMDLGLDIE